MTRICLTKSIYTNIPCGIATYAENLLSNLEKIDRETEYYTTFGNDRKQKVLIPHIDKLPYKNIWHVMYSGYHLSKYKFDIVHEVGNFNQITFLKSKKVLTIHDIVPKMIKGYGTLQVDFNLLLPECIRKTDIIIADSEYTKRDIIRRYGTDEDKIRVVPLAASMKFRRSGDDRYFAEVKAKYSLPDGFILYVGGVDRRKNLITLIDAYEKARQKGCKEKLVMVGIKFGRKILEREVRVRGLQKEVILIDFVGDDELVAIYNAGKLFVYPSLYEGFGLPILEAMACGVPVLCSGDTSLPEVGGDAAEYFNPNNTDEMAVKINELLNSETTLKRLQKMGMQRAGEFSWGKTARMTKEIYDELLRG